MFGLNFTFLGRDFFNLLSCVRFAFIHSVQVTNCETTSHLKTQSYKEPSINQAMDSVGTVRLAYLRSTMSWELSWKIRRWELESPEGHAHMCRK